MISYFRSVVFALLAISLLGLPTSGAAAQDATPEAGCVSTTPEQNEETMQFYWQEVVWGPQGKIADVVSPEVINHWGHGFETTGFDAFSETFAGILSAFPDMRYTVDLVAAQDDLVASAWTGAGSQSGEWQGIAPTNKEVTIDGIAIFRIECGMITETWVEANNFGLLAQLGSPDVPAFFADVAVAQASPAAQALPATPCTSDSAEANAALVARWFDEVWTAKNVDVLDEIADPDILHHAGGFPDAHGVEALKDAVRGFSEAELTADFVFTDGNLVVARWSGQGTLGGDFLGDRPSGQVVPMSGINIYRVNCGKIVESWSQISGLSMLNEVRAAVASATPAAG